MIINAPADFIMLIPPSRVGKDGLSEKIAEFWNVDQKVPLIKDKYSEIWKLWTDMTADDFESRANVLT